MTDGRKLVVVLGATGAQGSPTARYLLEHSSDLFRVRAVTRDPTKEAARELHNLGADVVAADFDDEASLVAAFDGANAIFAITNFWDKADYDLEVGQGKLVNKLAAALPNLESFIFSSLPDGREADGGRFQNILPYNAKAAIREDLQSYPALAAKTTEVYVAFYYQNWLKYQTVFGPQKDDDGSYLLSMPYSISTRFPCASANDTGVVIDSILRGGNRYYGRTVVLSTENPTAEETLSIWARALGIEARFKQVSPADHTKRMMDSGIPEHLAVCVTELSENLMFGGKTLSAEKLLQARDIIPSGYNLKSWQEYVKEEDWSALQ